MLNRREGAKERRGMEKDSEGDYSESHSERGIFRGKINVNQLS